MSVFVSKVTLCKISEKQYSFKFSGMCWKEEDQSRKKGIVGCGLDSHLLFTSIAAGLCVHTVVAASELIVM